MIWIHCGDHAAIASTRSLAKRLADQGSKPMVLVTAPPDTVDAIGSLPATIAISTAPTDSPTKARAFLDHFAPRYLIWNGGALRPALLRAVGNNGMPAVYMNAQVNGIIAGSARWIPGAARAAVSAFEMILTADGATATRLRRGGVPAAKVRATGPILEEPAPPPHDANELTVMVEALEARPTWMAAQVGPSEISHMATAHLAASRKSHRMMLLIAPDSTTDGPKVADELRSAGLKTGLRSDGDDPTADMQAYVADLPNEMGLWYRITPLTFIGGTLSTGANSSPFDPIAVGSAVIHGPQKSPYQDRFERLANVEASREVRTAAELGIAVGTLLSPEKTAQMALAGWEEITRTAHIINEIVQTAMAYADGERGAS